VSSRYSAQAIRGYRVKAVPKKPSLKVYKAVSALAAGQAVERKAISHSWSFEESMKVFIADDSHLFRRRLTEMICELEGVEIVGQAGHAQEVLEAITVQLPDVVTLDVNILGGSGIDVLTKIKQDRLAPVVIMLTNQSSLPYRKKCAQAGADFFVDKANEISDVRQIIEALLIRFNTQSEGRI